jgi:cardiolipin synthase
MPPETASWLTVPNLLTLLRLALIWPFAALAADGRDTAALAVFLAAALTDGLDGAMARRLGQRSKAGRLLDPLADKLLTGAAFVVLALFRGDARAVPLWIMGAAVARDALILAGSAVIYGARRDSGFQPSALGKLNTAVEAGVVLGFLAATPLPGLAPLLPVLYGLMAATLAASAAGYLRTGLRMLRKTPSADSVL